MNRLIKREPSMRKNRNGHTTFFVSLFLATLLAACKSGVPPTQIPTLPSPETPTILPASTPTITFPGTPTSTPAISTLVPWSNFSIVFRRSTGESSEIYLLNADESGMINLTNYPTHYESPKWSPDGTKIAFVSNRDGNMDIYVMNEDGSGVTNLSNDPDYNHSMAWSPDGTKIAFVTESNQMGNLEI